MSIAWKLLRVFCSSGLEIVSWYFYSSCFNERKYVAQVSYRKMLCYCFAVDINRLLIHKIVPLCMRSPKWHLNYAWPYMIFLTRIALATWTHGKYYFIRLVYSKLTMKTNGNKLSKLWELISNYIKRNLQNVANHPCLKINKGFVSLARISNFLLQKCKRYIHISISWY